jgi:hypothetical protein
MCDKPESWMMATPEIRASDKHLRAICAEIGDRLRQRLNKTAEDPPARLMAIVRRFAELEQIEAPSIVPSLEVAEESFQRDADALL